MHVYTPYVAVLLLTTVIAVLVGRMAWRRRTAAPASKPFALMMFAVAFYAGVAACEKAAIGLAAKKFWSTLEYVGSGSVITLFLLFCLAFTGQQGWLQPKRMGLLWVLPLCNVLLVATNPWHALVWSAVRPGPPGSNLAIYEHGPGFFWVLVGAYTYVFAGLLVLARTAFGPSMLPRRQSQIIFGGAIVPLLGATAYALELTPPALNITPISFLLSGVIYFFALFRLGVLDLVPVARDVLIEHMQTGVLVLDHRYRIVDVNPAASKLLALPPNAPGAPVTAVLDPHSNMLCALMQEAPTHADPLLLTTATHVLEITVMPLHNPYQTVTGWMFVLQDVTRQQQTEQQLRTVNAELQQHTTALQQARDEAEEARQKADAANQAKSTFLANMSHELRTPLNAILGFAQLIQRSNALPPEHAESLRIISRSGEHLLTLINHVLDLSKIEAGRTTLNAKDFDLHRLLDDMEDMFRLRADEKQLQFVIERGEGVPRSVRTDELKLRQVLINLLNNAIKFTETGGITLQVALAEHPERDAADAADAALVRFAVVDTGAGIAPDELDSLFEAFTQTETGRQAQEGTGLGLPISRQFVQVMGGEMQVQSSLGRGTVFSFTLRLELVAASAIAPTHPPRQVIALEPGQPRYRILVVDDRQENRTLLIKLLQPLGFEMREAGNGQEALEQWAAWEPHLIWMDMRMPVLDGYAATRQIKATTRGQATAIIALTASTLEEERTLVLSTGCDDFLRKPFREADLFEMMQKHIGVRYRYAEPASLPGAAPPDAQATEPHTWHAALGDLPADLVVDLYQAAIQADIDWLNRLVEPLRTHHEHLAEWVQAVIDDFDYDELLRQIEATGMAPAQPR